MIGGLDETKISTPPDRSDVATVFELNGEIPILACASAPFLISCSTAFCCENIANPQVNFGESKDIQQEVTSIFEVARPKELAQEVGDGCLKWRQSGSSSTEYCPIYQKMDLYFNGRNLVQVGFFFGGEELCTFAG